MQAVVPRRHDEVHNTIQEKGDRWTKEGQEWTRHHVEHRTRLYQPRRSADGPQLDQLEDERVTILRSTDGATLSTKDHWRDPNRATMALKSPWTGTTVFTEKGHFPQVMLEDYSEEAGLPKALIVPEEPTEEDR